jgi:predicted anti-sigma-YlaC factor YlaD
MADANGQRAGGGDPREHLNDEVLSAYLDTEGGGLSPAARAVADAHLASCAECRVALEDLTATVAMLRALPQIAPRRSFILTEEAAAAVGGPRLPRRVPLWVWPSRWATALAALVFAITVGLDRGAAPVAPPDPSPTVAVAVAVGTPNLAAMPSLCDDVPTAPDCLRIAGLTPTVFPTPTAIPHPAARAAGTTEAATDWRPVQFVSGLVALIGAFFGFVLPPALRRRNGTPA